MATPLPRPSASPGQGVVPAEWPAQAADTIVDTIDKVRAKTTRPAIVAARAIVYGLLAAIVGLTALILALVLVVRLWANYVPGHVWIIYAVLAVLMMLAGIVLLRKATGPAVRVD